MSPKWKAIFHSLRHPQKDMTIYRLDTEIVAVICPCGWTAGDFERWNTVYNALKNCRP